MKNRPEKPYIIISLTIISFLTIIAISIVGIFLNSRKTATLEITVAPASAEILINGKSYRNGSYQLEPGTYPVKISKENFETYEGEISLTAGETTELKKYLLEVGGGTDWYLDHNSDMMIMNSIGDSEADAEADNYSKKDPIFSITPYYDEKNNHFSISAIDKKTAGEKITIKINANACVEPLITQYSAEAETYLKNQGITLENYNLLSSSLCD